MRFADDRGERRRWTVIDYQQRVRAPLRLGEIKTRLGCVRVSRDMILRSNADG